MIGMILSTDVSLDSRNITIAIRSAPGSCRGSAIYLTGVINGVLAGATANICVFRPSSPASSDPTHWHHTHEPLSAGIESEFTPAMH
jgi:hypothetical protein